MSIENTQDNKEIIKVYMGWNGWLIHTRGNGWMVTEQRRIGQVGHLFRGCPLFYSPIMVYLLGGFLSRWSFWLDCFYGLRLL